MNALAIAQRGYDNAVPDSYYDDPTKLERAHQIAFDEFIDSGFLVIASVHQAGRALPGETACYDQSIALEEAGFSKDRLFHRFLSAYAGRDEAKCKQAADALAAACIEHAEKWIKENVSESYGS